MERKNDLVWNWPGGIPRLALHEGAAEACYDLGLPMPDEMLVSSAGYFAASSIIGCLNDGSFARPREVIGNLSPDQIFSYRRKLKVKLGVLGGITIGLVGGLILLDYNASKTKKTLAGLGGLATLLAADALVGNELMYGESLLSPGPLMKLLTDKNTGLDFKAIFNSPIRLGVIVADIGSKERKPGVAIFYNHDPKNSDPQNPAHTGRWIKIGLASSRLPGKFPFVQIDGIDTVDGEVWTDFPIKQMKNFKKIIRFDYWPPLQLEPTPKVALSDVHRSFEIMRDRITQEEMDNYELERQANPALPEVYCVRLSPELMKAAPHIQLHNFTPDDMKALQNIGYATIMEQKEEIRRYLEK